MSRNLPRKRHLQPQNEIDENRVQATNAILLSGKHVRWLQKGLLRRVRLLFSLLRRYPVVVVFLFLIVWIGWRLYANTNVTSPRPHSSLQFQHETAKMSQFSFQDDELIESFEQRELQRLSNFRYAQQGVFMDVQLEGARKAILKLLVRESSRNSSHPEYLPRLHQLAKLLRCHHGFMNSYQIKLPIILQEPLADRRLAKAFCRACGFRSPSKVADGTTVAAYVVPVQSDSLRFVSALRTPTIEPYEWTSNFPTAHECGLSGSDQAGKNTVQKRCRRLTEIMIVMYLGGCGPPGNDDFVQWDENITGDDDTLRMAFPDGCFGHYEDNSVLLDIVLAFVGKSCSLPSGLLGRINGLLDIKWGVGKRAKTLKKQLELLNHGDSGYRNCNWTFYEANGD